MSKKAGAKTPAATANKKDESRHDQFWYPIRCELPSCSVTEQTDLKKCGACGMVQYCCPEHQKADWPEHKSECKVFRRLGVRATFYSDADMLAKYPLQPSKRFDGGYDEDDEDEGGIPKGAVCKLCLASDREVEMTRTRCCGQVVCDTSHNYQIMSYSREFCQRSHDRYTLCGYHGVEKECDRSKDWRECPECIKPSRDSWADTLWRGLNPYNYCPMLSKDVPKHARCDVCAKCRSKFMSGLEGCCYGRDGLTCTACSGNPLTPMAVPTGPVEIPPELHQLMSILNRQA